VFLFRTKQVRVVVIADDLSPSDAIARVTPTDTLANAAKQKP